jgi:purine-binding chemotaxis protein CheW
MNESLKFSAESNEETLHGRYLTFQVGNEMYGIQIRYVIEIVGLQPVTVMPEMPEYIKGIINLRGKVIPIMDVRLRFGLPWKEYDDRTCIIVINMNEVSVGIVIDSVSDVLTINDDEILKKPEMSAKEDCGYVNCLGRKAEQVILLIDCEKLLSKNDINKVSGCN